MQFKDQRQLRIRVRVERHLVDIHFPSALHSTAGLTAPFNSISMIYTRYTGQAHGTAGGGQLAW
jgi:hypothetical protein